MRTHPETKRKEACRSAKVKVEPVPVIVAILYLHKSHSVTVQRFTDVNLTHYPLSELRDDIGERVEGTVGKGKRGVGVSFERLLVNTSESD